MAFPPAQGVEGPSAGRWSWRPRPRPVQTSFSGVSLGRPREWELWWSQFWPPRRTPSEGLWVPSESCTAWLSSTAQLLPPLPPPGPHRACVPHAQFPLPYGEMEPQKGSMTGPGPGL